MSSATSSSSSKPSILTTPRASGSKAYQPCVTCAVKEPIDGNKRCSDCEAMSVDERRKLSVKLVGKVMKFLDPYFEPLYQEMSRESKDRFKHPLFYAAVEARWVLNLLCRRRLGVMGDHTFRRLRVEMKSSPRRVDLTIGPLIVSFGCGSDNKQITYHIHCDGLEDAPSSRSKEFVMDHLMSQFCWEE